MKEKEKKKDEGAMERKMIEWRGGGTEKIGERGNGDERENNGKIEGGKEEKGEKEEEAVKGNKDRKKEKAKGEGKGKWENDYVMMEEKDKVGRDGERYG